MCQVVEKRVDTESAGLTRPEILVTFTADKQPVTRLESLRHRRRASGGQCVHGKYPVRSSK